MDDEYRIIKVYPEAKRLSEDLQAAVGSGHLWVKAIAEAPITYLIFCRHLFTFEEAQVILRRHLDAEAVQHGG